ncbi:MAG: hypothetical protein ACM37U_10465 [Gemmatimonas sp.]
MRTSVLILAIVSLLSPREGVAQAPEVLAPKTRIRYELPTDRRAIIAEVLVHRGESLWVRRPQSADTAIFGLLGAGIGALIGRESRTDRWEPALLTSRGRIATWSGRRRNGYGLRFSYSVF